MINSGYAALLFVASVLPANSLFAQVKYARASPETIQQRLELYKGNDATRKAALVTLFIQAGCQPENLSEQPVPDRKQPNVI